MPESLVSQLLNSSRTQLSEAVDEFDWKGYDKMSIPKEPNGMYLTLTLDKIERITGKVEYKAIIKLSEWDKENGYFITKVQEGRHAGNFEKVVDLTFYKRIDLPAELYNNLDRF